MSTHKIKRNDPCPCGSGQKYKQCCMKKEQASRRTRTILAHQVADQQEMTAELAEDFAAYEATFDEIEVATEAMDAYRPQFEQTLKDPRAIADHAQRLFAEERFEAYRYTATDLRRACDASAYPEPPTRDDSDYVQFLNIATAYLADRENRLHIATELLQMIPFLQMHSCKEY